MWLRFCNIQGRFSCCILCSGSPQSEKNPSLNTFLSKLLEYTWHHLCLRVMVAMHQPAVPGDGIVVPRRKEVTERGIHPLDTACTGLLLVHSMYRRKTTGYSTGNLNCWWNEGSHTDRRYFACQWGLGEMPSNCRANCSWLTGSVEQLMFLAGSPLLWETLFWKTPKASCGWCFWEQKLWESLSSPV